MCAPALIRGPSAPRPFGGNAPPFRPLVLPAIREGGRSLCSRTAGRSAAFFPPPGPFGRKRIRFGAASANFRPFRITLYKRQPGAPGIKVGSCTAGEVRDVCIYNA